MSGIYIIKNYIFNVYFIHILPPNIGKRLDTIELKNLLLM